MIHQISYYHTKRGEIENSHLDLSLPLVLNMVVYITNASLILLTLVLTDIMFLAVRKHP